MRRSASQGHDSGRDSVRRQARRIDLARRRQLCGLTLFEGGVSSVIQRDRGVPGSGSHAPLRKAGTGTLLAVESSWTADAPGALSSVMEVRSSAGRYLPTSFPRRRRGGRGSGRTEDVASVGPLDDAPLDEGPQLAREDGVAHAAGAAKLGPW